MKNNFGYTLIELVVVAGILGVIGVVSAGLFLTTLSSGGKSSGLNDIRANGDYAITQIERTIHNAVRVEGVCNADMTSLSLLNPDGSTSVFSNSSSKIALNSESLISDDVELDGDMDFDCVRRDSGTPEEITVTFSLQKVNSQVTDSSYAQAEFSTTAQLRRY